MLLESTCHRSPAVSFREALLRGVAPDGGLYLPVTLPAIAPAELCRWRGAPFPELAAWLAERLLVPEFSAAVVRRLTAEALDIEVPAIALEPGHFVLELFHGPTLAFKDFGARFLARFVGYLLAETGATATILVATSGDTGGAVAHGFHAVAHVRVVVLYPAGQVSRFQEAQMAMLGGNVIALRVPGTFDDCQRLVKAAFLDEELTRLRLSSANSINIGRLLPQAFYYVAGWLAAGAEGEPVTFAVPSGNLGNLTAAVIAGRLGVPLRRLIAATNANAALPDYITTGMYRSRPSIRTISSAMDVGAPSNFARLIDLAGGSAAALTRWIWSASMTDAETRQTIRTVYDRTGYVLDPHTAVAVAAGERYEREQGSSKPLITLATAHPAKFADVIASELGFAPELPERLRGWETRTLQARDLSGIEYETFRDVLLGLDRGVGS